jgi:hypothetical protein
MFTFSPPNIPLTVHSEYSSIEPLLAIPTHILHYSHSIRQADQATASERSQCQIDCTGRKQKIECLHPREDPVIRVVRGSTVHSNRDREPTIPWKRSKTTEQHRNNTPTPNMLIRDDAKRVREAILTAIDKSVVVLGVCLCAVSFPRKVNGGNTLGATGTVVVKRNFF